MIGASSIDDPKCCSLSLNFVCQEWKKNRRWQRTHRQGTMKRCLSIHSNAPCLLERRISEHPHFKHTMGFMAACIRIFCFPLWWVDITISKKAPRSSDLGVANCALIESLLPTLPPH